MKAALIFAVFAVLLAGVGPSACGHGAATPKCPTLTSSQTPMFNSTLTATETATEEFLTNTPQSATPSTSIYEGQGNSARNFPDQKDAMPSVGTSTLSISIGTPDAKVAEAGVLVKDFPTIPVVYDDLTVTNSNPIIGESVTISTGSGCLALHSGTTPTAIFSLPIVVHLFFMQGTLHFGSSPASAAVSMTLTGTIVLSGGCALKLTASQQFTAAKDYAGHATAADMGTLTITFDGMLSSCDFIPSTPTSTS